MKMIGEKNYTEQNVCVYCYQECILSSVLDIFEIGKCREITFIINAQCALH